MGLSASQGRLLMLTARKSDTELRAQQISQQRLILANQTEQAVRKYTEATNNRVLMFKRMNSDEGKIESVRLTLDHIYDELEAQGYSLVDADNNELSLREAQNLGYSNETILQYALENGAAFLAKVTDESEGELVKQSIAGMSVIASEYDTKDDSAAEAEYQLEKTKIQNKDKRLELDLKQVETQHKALETEVESVQKVIQKNVETSFKTFS